MADTAHQTPQGIPATRLLLSSISNLSSRNKDEFEQQCLNSRAARAQDSSTPAQQQQSPHTSQQQQVGKQAAVAPAAITGAEEQLWKGFSASFRRRNNKIG